MLIVTIESIPGKTLEPLGLVKGSTIQTLATERMTAEAQALGADAVVGVRYASSSIMQSAAEVMAYGTAVKLR